MQKELESGNQHVVLVTQMLEKFGILSQPGGGEESTLSNFFSKEKDIRKIKEKHTQLYCAVIFSIHISI